MYKIINKIGKLGLCLLLLSTVVACGSNIDDSETIDHKTIATANMEEDINLFVDIQEVYLANLEKAKTQDQECVVALKYLDDVYQLTSNRFNLDADILTVFPDEYVEYVGLCHSYAKTYLEEKEDLVKDKNIWSLDYIEKGTGTGTLLKILEDYYHILIENYDYRIVD